MKSFKTPKGTELPILNLKGKDYLQVQHRVVWFLEEHPNWSIETGFIEFSSDSALALATIKDETGRIIRTAHKRETKGGFGDFHEKAETGAIGRALALCGFGTQFASEDLDEGNRIVDAPTPRIQKIPSNDEIHSLAEPDYLREELPSDMGFYAKLDAEEVCGVCGNPKIPGRDGKPYCLTCWKKRKGI